MSNKNQECFELEGSASIQECSSVATPPVTTPGGTTGGIVARVPVTLAERTVSTSLSAKIKFPNPVLEIKDVKKRVKIIQCSLMVPPVEPGVNPFTPTDAQLFLKGFLRKNIQFATPILQTGNSCITSNIRSHTIDLPWECLVTIPADEFISPPQRPVLNVRGEFDFLTSRSLGSGFPEKDTFISSDLSQFHQSSTQFYNAFPFCELISSNITEWDEAIDRKPLQGKCAVLNEGTFQTIIEKVFLQFTIKVLQNQQAAITLTGNGGA
nr:DUF3794 domain-containing protein [uncultured Bacillus sp.]